MRSAFIGHRLTAAGWSVCIDVLKEFRGGGAGDLCHGVALVGLRLSSLLSGSG